VNKAHFIRHENGLFCGLLPCSENPGSVLQDIGGVPESGNRISGRSGRISAIYLLNVYLLRVERLRKMTIKTFCFTRKETSNRLAESLIFRQLVETSWRGGRWPTTEEHTPMSRLPTC